MRDNLSVLSAQVITCRRRSVYLRLTSSDQIEDGKSRRGERDFAAQRVMPQLCMSVHFDCEVTYNENPSHDVSYKVKESKLFQPRVAEVLRANKFSYLQ